MTTRFCADTTSGQVCGQVFDGDTQRCPAHQAAANQRQAQRRGTTTQRGYGPPHQALRTQLIAQWIPGQPCAHCGRPMTDRNDLDLAHTPDRTGYRGLAHSACNRGNR